MDKVAIIIVNWNTGKLLSKCVESLLTLGFTSKISDIVVIDNASTDPSMTLLLNQLPILPHRELVQAMGKKNNAGFAGGNNSGIRWIREKYGSDIPHILLLNPDTKVPTGSIDTLVNTLNSNEKIGIIGPELLNADGTHQPSVRAFPTLRTIATTLLKLTRVVSSTNYWQHYMQTSFDFKRTQAVDQVMGAAFLIRNTTVQNVGLLDEGYFVWFEEVDYCRTAKTKGWEVWYTPDATVVHYGGASFAQLVGFKRTLPWLKSSLRYTRKHLGVLATAIVLLIAPLTIFLTIPASFFHLLLKKQNKSRLND